MATDRPRRQWRRCRRIVDGLELPTPFEAGVFIGALARTRGRPIALIPMPLPPQTPCGMLISTDSSDYIVYAANTGYLHQQHILLHEAAHLICGHDGSSPAASPAARVLAPHLSDALVQRVLGRAVYAEPQEREAELVASLILTRADHLARTASAARPLPGPPAPYRLSGPHRLFGPPEDRTAADASLRDASLRDGAVRDAALRDTASPDAALRDAAANQGGQHGRRTRADAHD